MHPLPPQQPGRRDPVRNPRLNGAYATKPMPSSAQTGTTDSSSSRLNSDHSFCTAAIGWTRWPARSCSALTLDRPM
nr:hypothetical protein [Nonomuraea aridisoli]